MNIEFQNKVSVNAKTLKIHIKTCDEFSARLIDDKGNELKDYDGYVPSFMPGQHFGDYLILDIDIDSGQITNWPKITANQIQNFLAEGQEED